MYQIEANIYYEDAYSGVTLGALFFPHGTILIDAPLRSDEARSWKSVIQNYAKSSNRILVNLDAHPDRTLGARAMECTILAHQKTAQVFRNRPSVFKGQSQDTGAEWESSNDMVGTRWLVPEITFTHWLSLNWGNNEEVILQHHPGPTQGSIWVIIPKAKVVFVGDGVFADQTPFLASSDLPAWIGSMNELIKSYRDYHIISGRGGPVSIDTIRAQKRMFKGILKGIEKLAKRNAPPDLTENLIPNLIAGFNLPPEKREQYTQRLRHGLYQYYARHYRALESSDQD